MAGQNKGRRHILSAAFVVVAMPSWWAWPVSQIAQRLARFDQF
jgi:hypothetical protein